MEEIAQHALQLGMAREGAIDRVLVGGVLGEQPGECIAIAVSTAVLKVSRISGNAAMAGLPAQSEPAAIRPRFTGNVPV